MNIFTARYTIYKYRISSKKLTNPSTTSLPFTFSLTKEDGREGREVTREGWRGKNKELFL
jgi:hypothetical protein